MAVRPTRWHLPPAPTGDSAFRQLKAAIMARTGHFYYDDKNDLLWERVAKRLRATGLVGPEAYLALLAGEAGDAEWQALEAEVTIGETFFFRYAEQFSAIRNTILPRAIARNRERRQLRLWSAGSSNGSEAYTLAIVVHEVMQRELGAEAQTWRVGILGTDINEPTLERARRAEFGAWAVRTLGPEDKARYFLPAPPAGPWRVRPEYRALVHFERHNLMSLVEGTAPLQFTGFDLILCRNVLIYFHPDVVPRMVAGLGEALAPGGWLLLGHAEPSIAFGAFLDVVDLPGTVAYRRHGASVPSPPPAAWVPLLPAPGDTGLDPRAGTHRPRRIAGQDQAGPDRDSGAHGRQAGWAAGEADADPALRRARPTAPPVVDPHPHPGPAGSWSDSVTGLVPARLPDSGDAALAAATLEAARALADAGDIEGALQRLREVPATLDPEVPFLEGVLNGLSGRHVEAATLLGRAVYLDRRFVMAHYHLGLALSAGGDVRKGRRVMAHAARLAAQLPDTSELPWGDGLTAGALVALTRAIMARAEPLR